MTVTLPGYWHGIRKSSPWAQYAYITGRQSLPGRGGLWPMRGLNVRLMEEEHTVLGGWHFVECTFNSKTHCWNFHFHSILLGGCPSWLPLSETTVDDDFQRSVVDGSKSLELRKLGFGEIYSLARAQDTGEVIAYCTELAYASKQSLKGPAVRLQAFLGSVKPRLVRPFGIARMSLETRVNWHLEQGNGEIADMLIAKAQ